MIKRIGVFCGSSPGAQEEYTNITRQLGKEIARRNLGLVYGGGIVGLMGELAAAALDAGGEVIGVIPEALLNLEIVYENLTELKVVASMHERKAVMENISDGFIALPGGYGTIEEIFEVLTWAQLKIHRKPCGFLNIDGYFNLLLQFLDHPSDAAVRRKTIHCGNHRIALISDLAMTFGPPSKMRVIIILVPFISIELDLEHSQHARAPGLQQPLVAVPNNLHDFVFIEMLVHHAAAIETHVLPLKWLYPAFFL